MAALDASNIVPGNRVKAADVIQFFNLFTGALTGQPITFKNRLTLTRDAVAGPTTLEMLKLTAVADTGITAGEMRDVWLDLSATRQFSVGAIPAAQRAVYIQAPTYSATGAGTLTSAATLAISGPPVAGTNLTLTNTHPLWVVSGFIRTAQGTGGIQYGADGPIDTAWLGTPEGNVLAQPGSTCRDRTNGVLYVKTVTGGTATTGWLLMGTTTVKSIQRGTGVLLNAGSILQLDVTITSVDTTKAMLNFLGAEGGNALNSQATRIKLLNATTIRMNRNAAAFDTNVNYECVEFF